MQTGPFAADNIVRMKVLESYGAEEVAAERRCYGDQFGELIACMTPDPQAGSPA